MDLLTGILIGVIYGRNMHTINQKTYEDVCKVARAISKTHFAMNVFYMLEGIYLAIERRYVNKAICTNNILCECNRRTCKPLKINTYARKLKAIN